jgi:hypothetical protein
MRLSDLTREQIDSSIFVGLLTQSQKEEIAGQVFALDSYFNPILDGDNNWIISVQEIDQCINPLFLWVKDLPLIEYKPKDEQQ